MVEIVFKTRRVVFDFKRIKNKQVDQICLALNKVKNSHNVFIKYPLQEVPVKDENGIETGEFRKETHDEWRIRILNKINDSLERLPNESDLDYDRRLIKQNLENHISVLCFEFINEILALFSLPPLPQEEFDEGSVEDCRNFCYDVLATIGIKDPDGTFFPPLRAEAITRGAGLDSGSI